MAMNYNPYAAPTADARMGAPGAGALGGPQPWSAGEVLGLGWEAVKRDFPVLVFAPFMAMVIAQIPSGINSALTMSGAIDEPAIAAILGGLLSILGSVISVFFLVGQIRIFVTAARGESPEFSTLFSGGDRFIWLLLTQICVGFVVVIGLILLIVPGIIAMLGLYLAQFYCVEANMGPIEAMKASWESTKGQKGDIFVLILLSGLVILAGLMAFCVGMFVAIPVIWVAMAIAYLRISGRGAPAMAGAGFGPPPGAPPGGYAGGFGAPPGGFGGPPPGGGFGAPPGGFGGPPQGGGYGGPPQGGGGYPPPGGGWGG